jgi:putative thioredoxin
MTDSAAKSPWVIDADEANFQRDAVERSRELLVVVDFWAAWCQPCRLLGPILEQLAVDYAGKFLLVKADVDKLPQVAAGFGVESIPAVYAVRDGQLVDFFVGLLSEPQIRAWIDRLLPTPAESLVAEGRRLAGSDQAAAESKYRAAIELDPNLAAAKIGLAELLLGQGRGDDVRSILNQLEERGFLEPEAEKLKAQIHLAQAGASRVDLDQLAAKVKANPSDLAAKLELAEALAGAQQYEEALEAALAIVSLHDKRFTDAARTLMVDIFRTLGDESELTTTYRRRLSTALY